MGKIKEIEKGVYEYTGTTIEVSDKFGAFVNEDNFKRFASSLAADAVADANISDADCFWTSSTDVNKIEGSFVAKVHATKTKRRVKTTEELSASEALFGFCAWLTTQKAKTVMSSSDECSVICNRIKTFCKVNNLTDPREHWTDLCKPGPSIEDNKVGPCIVDDGGVVPPANLNADLLNALSALSGDLSYDNVAKAKSILKRLLGDKK